VRPRIPRPPSSTARSGHGILDPGERIGAHGSAQTTQAQELGGEWRWNVSLNKCQTSVQLTISTAPMSAGNCTQVG